MIRYWGAAIAILGVAAATPVSAGRTTERYTSMTVFGDSLVDAGNYHLLTGEPNEKDGFYNNHFTNGPNYADLISKELFGYETVPSGLGGSNYAIAAARLVDIGDPIPDFDLQITTMKTFGAPIDPNGLYVVTLGANDVFAANGVFDLLGGMGPVYAGNPLGYLQKAAAEYVAGIERLDALGARNIFITDFPLAGTPYTKEANEYLQAALANVKLHDDTDLFVYSLAELNTRIISNPAAFGLPAQDLKTSCIDAKAQPDCSGYFYFDGVHPTAAIQKIAFEDMNQRFALTASVPEPTTWAMMIVGFGAIGVTLRRKRGEAKAALA